jgi:hypothetical protein
LPLTVQQGLLNSRYDGLVYRTRNGLTWLGQLTPATYTDTYEVLLDHVVGQSPIIFVVRPRLELRTDQDLPHVYSLNTLCLYYGAEEWNPSRPLADLVGWSCEWLLHYEIWVATGEWLAGGVHPGGVVSNRAARRPSSGRRRRLEDVGDRHESLKRHRLIAALRRVYGKSAFAADLLVNANGRRAE